MSSKLGSIERRGQVSKRGPCWVISDLDLLIRGRELTCLRSGNTLYITLPQAMHRLFLWQLASRLCKWIVRPRCTEYEVRRLCWIKFWSTGTNTSVGWMWTCNKQLIVRVWGLASFCYAYCKVSIPAYHTEHCLEEELPITFMTRGVSRHLFDWATGLSITKTPPILKPGHIAMMIRSR